MVQIGCQALEWQTGSLLMVLEHHCLMQPVRACNVCYATAETAEGLPGKATYIGPTPSSCVGAL